MQQKTPCAYLPLTAVFIDDSEGFLTQVKETLSQDYPYLTFNNSQHALRYIKKNVEKFSKQTYGFSSDADNSINSTSINIKANLQELHRIIYDPERFNEVSVVVVDYQMPGMNGGEFCTKLEDLPIQKIMLTGEADSKTAIDLFNKGTIQKFIMKNSRTLSSDINNAITELQQEYFIKKYSDIYKSLFLQKESLLSLPIYQKLIANHVHKCNAFEYYLIDSTGSYLFLDDNGKPSWFLVATQEQMHDIYEVGRDQKASESILRLIENRQSIPYFTTNKELFSGEGNGWQPYLYPATNEKGILPFWYAVVTDKTVTTLYHDKIKSFHEYLYNDWPPDRN